MFDIRAELPSNRYFDFKISAYDLEPARAMAEDVLKYRFPSLENPKFDWRGLVVFVRSQPTPFRP